MKKILLFLILLLVANTQTFAQIPQYFKGGGTGGNAIPFGAQSWADQRCQFLYLPGEILPIPPAGFITKIYFRAYYATTNNVYTGFQAEIGQPVGLTSFTGTAWVTGLTSVVSPSTLTIPVTTAGNWFEIPLQTPFYFDPTLPLVVDTRQPTTSASSPYLYIYTGTATPTGNRRQYGASAAAVPAGASNTFYDFGFDLIQGFPCNGVPTTTLEGPNEVCPKKNFTVTFGTFYTGVTRQWQKSTDGINWTNFTGTINVNTGAITDAITVNTYYRCILTCLATNQTYTATKFVKIAPFYYCYCDQTSISATGIDIGNVTVTTVPANDTLLNNGLGTPLENNPQANKGYTFYSMSVPAIPMYHDSTYKFIVQQINSGTFTAGMATIFIDYNRNGTFDDTERILLKPTANVLPNPGVVNGNFKLPDSARYGLTGMRVIIGSGNSAPDSCANTANGETEDYLVDLRYIPCSGKPDSASIEGDTSMCAGYKYILTDSVYEKYRHGIARFWQISADGVGWADIAASTNKDTLTRIFDGQPFYYRVQTVCTHTNDTTSGHAHKVNIKPSYKCYCHSQSSGTAKDTSDIGAFNLAALSTSEGSTHLLNPKAFRQRQDFTDLEPLQINVDSIYNFSMFHTMPYQNHADGKVTVFVDFNNNHKYDIPDERIYTGFTSIGYHVLLNALIIPNNVIVDVPTGMRIIINNDVAPNIPSDEACGEYTSGETEDYILMFKRPFPVGIKEAEGVNQLSLVPNPTSGKFQVQFKGAASQEGVTVRILNVTGQLVKQQVYPHNGGIFRQQVDLGNEAKGMYMVEVISDGQKMTHKLTVQ
jgi:hypothetical protein